MEFALGFVSMFITITRYQRTNEKKLQQQQRNNKNNNKETFIIKIPNPTGGFIGAIAVDKKRNVVWTSMLSFATKGEILRYNITSKTFDTFILHEQLSFPLGLAVDNNDNLWATDHETSIFYTLNTANHHITMFATSKASPKIYGLNESGSLPEGAYTLPYWIEKGANDGSL